MAKNKNVRNRRQKSRKNSGLRWHKRGIVLTTLVIVLLGGMVTAGSVSLWSRNNAYKAQEAELQEKSARLIELDAALNMEAGPAAEAICEEEPAEPSEKTEKPSLQARLSKAGEERNEGTHSPKQRSCEEIR